MPATVTMKQHPVGHGGFHSGLVLSTSSVPFSWVFDCGSRSGVVLKRELAAWEATTPRRLDWLFISHFDYDHVSGLEALFKRRRVRSVMLPYLNEEATAWMLCETILNPRAKRLVDLIVDPVAWFGARGVERIYLLQSDADDSDEGDDVERASPEGEGPPGEWKETITPAPRLVSPGRRPGEPDVFVLDGRRCAVEAGDGLAAVRLEPFRAPVEPWRHVGLIAALCAVAGYSNPPSLHVLAKALALKAQSSRGRKQIQAVYARGIGSSNRSSLSLMAKVEPVWGLAATSEVRRGGAVIAHCVGPAAWFSTGDAELLQAADLEAWSARFQDELPYAAVVALPHHGSDLNSTSAFQNLNPGALLTVHVSKSASRHHPGPRTIRDSAGRLARVTQDRDSAVRLLSWIQ